MEKTDKSADWIARAVAANPVTQLPNGNFTSGPVRLSWPNLFERGKAMEEGQEGKYGAALLFPEQTDLAVLRKAVLACARENFPNNFDAQGRPSGLHFPFRDQAEKQRFDGYVPGRFFITCTSNQKPPVVDHNLKPITDTARSYPGVWAIVSMNVFSWDRRVKKGVSLGLQSVMLVADDLRLGATADPNADFAAIKPIETDTEYSGAAAFGQTAGTTAAPGGEDETEYLKQLGLA